jgi:small subunit ribosomal protein S16
VAVRIRLARHGKTKNPFYRIVATDSQMRRSGRYLEQLGTLETLKDPPAITLKQDRVEYWLSVGARPTHTTAKWIEKVMPGHLSKLEENQLAKTRASRSARKARSKAKGKPSKAKKAKAAEKPKKKAKKKAVKAKAE